MSDKGLIDEVWWILKWTIILHVVACIYNEGYRAVLITNICNLIVDLWVKMG